MNIIVHTPKDKTEKEALMKRVAAAHAEYILKYIEKLDISAEQKSALIDIISIMALPSLSVPIESLRDTSFWFFFLLLNIISISFAILTLRL